MFCLMAASFWPYIWSVTKKVQKQSRRDHSHTFKPVWAFTAHATGLLKKITVFSEMVERNIQLAWSNDFLR